VLLGQAAGDALGVGYEGRKGGRWPWKMIGGRSGFEPGEWTGDTQQAVIVATARSEPLAVAGGLLDWYAGDACVLWSLAIERAVLDGDGYDEGGRGDDGMGLGGFDLRAEFERDCQLWLPVERRDFWSQTIAVACGTSLASARNFSAVGAFKAALHAIMPVGDLVDGLRSAVSIGGDTGRVAAIAGSLLGALFGAEGLMPEWRALLHGWPGLDAEGLEQLAQEAADRPRSG
jgi:ADP-ribosylglycohydrolase